LATANFTEYNVDIDTADDCDSAMAKIKMSANTNPFDIIFLDINLPESSDGLLVSGEDLAVQIKKILPDTKIIILTGFNENFRIQNILSTVDPAGLLIKTDINSNELLKAFKKVVHNPPYYSTSVMQFLRKKMFNQHYRPLDEINRKILYHLSKRVKTKNLVNHVPLSLSAIEKRKSDIKMILGVENADDEELLKKAKKLGFI